MNGYSITRDKFLSVAEAKKLLRVSRRCAQLDQKAKRVVWVTRYMLIHLALHSGLRVSEIASLKIGDLHFNGKDNYLTVQCGKGKRKRDVYLDQELVGHLRDYISVKEKEWKNPVEPESPLFRGRNGAHYTTTALHISFKNALQKAGLSMHYSIHSARHSYATYLIAKSKSIRFVQKQLGHASIVMTSLYADVLPEMNQALAETILK